MLSKCANPSCSTELVYLREGKVFMIEHTGNPLSLAVSGAAKPKSLNRVEHFWLCGSCAPNLTLAYDRKDGVQIIPKKAGKVFRAAS
ncbi:MAG TPA: hypothetical protein VFB79_18155 [Candidatus Angelobacter sp.]|nr:hypothetical protein [Candidatus Angelobacter sp.]